jgi:putative hydrolase of the HAD superfamily
MIDVIDMDPFCKPYPQAFKAAMNMVGDPIPENYLLLDDSIKNVQTAISLGMSAIHVSPERSNLNEIKHITNIHDLKNVYPPIMKG